MSGDGLIDPRACTLHRIEQDEYATWGVFVDHEQREICKTLELPWRDNATRVSCIPAGTYLCKRRWSAKHGMEVFEITGVPHRADIEIHPANWPSQLLGCVATGTAYGTIEGAKGVTQSRAAFARFMGVYAGVTVFPLTVVNPT